MYTPPLGTAALHVLLKLTGPKNPSQSWSRNRRTTLYLKPELDERLCQLLARHGLVSESPDDGCTLYTVTEAGRFKADEIRPF